MSLTVKSLLRCAQNFDACCIENVALIPFTKATNAPTVQVHLRPHPRRKALCSCCQQSAPGYDTLAQRQWHYLHLLHCMVVHYYASRRVNCPRCGVRVEWSG